jgi:CRISP-associated protein Cas1
MATLYVQEQGATLRKRDNQLVITKEDQTLQAVPMAKVDQVVVMGRGVQISTALLADLLERGIPVTLTNQHGSRHIATLSAGPSRFGELRLEQMELVRTPARALDLAKSIVRAKLTNQRALLGRVGWAASRSASQQIERALASAQGAKTLDELRGYEGTAAAAYFGAWRAALPAAWGFQGRAYYPPPDPLNALLSFGYTLALHDVLVAIQITGLDPYLGVFHVADPGRPSLGLDLLEEFRPLLVDALVLHLVQSGALMPQHFGRPSGGSEGMHLGPAGRAIFIEHYERTLRSQVALARHERTALRRVILLQAQAVARLVRGDQPRYSGFTPLS